MLTIFKHKRFSSTTHGQKLLLWQLFLELFVLVVRLYLLVKSSRFVVDFWRCLIGRVQIVFGQLSNEILWKKLSASDQS